MTKEVDAGISAVDLDECSLSLFDCDKMSEIASFLLLCTITLVGSDSVHTVLSVISCSSTPA